MIGDIHAEVAQRLRRARQRYTGGRRKLVETLTGANRPLSITEILDAHPGLPQSTLYRNLQVLEQAGAVRRVVTVADTSARFELAEDLTAHHHHLICVSCGSVRDFRPSSRLERMLDRALDDAGRRDGFVADHHRLDLVGVCSDCDRPPRLGSASPGLGERLAERRSDPGEEVVDPLDRQR
ncbi:MAG: transcriptional repressor [Actinomycetota bacterium]|nr:transcriptional repressor [Actinomycetota bacterium]